MAVRKLSVACVGEAMIELSLIGATDCARMSFAGDTLNTAIYMRRALPKSAEVAFVSVLGTDNLSNRMLSFIEAEGVSTRALARFPERLPGIYAIATDSRGERSFSYWRENSAARLLFRETGKISFAALERFDVVYFSAITLAILSPEVRAAFLDWLAEYRQRSAARVVFDSNYRPVLWAGQTDAQDWISRAWALTNIGLPSIDDERALFGDSDEATVLERLLGYGLRDGALKRGALGPVPIKGELPPGVAFPPVQKVVDTTAAGDSFNGAFLGRYLTGSSLGEAMYAGHECASTVIGCRGAIIPRDGNGG